MGEAKPLLPTFLAIWRKNSKPLVPSKCFKWNIPWKMCNKLTNKLMPLIRLQFTHFEPKVRAIHCMDNANDISCIATSDKWI